MNLNPTVLEYVVPNIDLNLLTQKQLSDIKYKLDTYGLCVLPCVFKDNECNQYVTQSVDWLTDLLPPLTRNPATWTSQNTPSGPRMGLYQSIVSHCPIAWILREKLYPLFCGLWNTKELITSLDGATILPPTHIESNDWPHIDQTKPESEIHCYQGQVVLTDTTACFRCTPGSHLKHDELSKKYGFNLKNQWYKFTDPQILELKNTFEKWQIPIYTPKGSIILWRSTLIHSAQYVTDVNKYKNLENTERWMDGWRCTYYICQRPKNQFTNRNLTSVKNAVLNGRTTNHWGTKTFSKKGR